MTRIRFSLASLMGLVVVAALICAGLTWHFKAVRVLRQEAEMLRQEAMEQAELARASEARARNEAEAARRVEEHLRKQLEQVGNGERQSTSDKSSILDQSEVPRPPSQAE